MSVSEAYFIVIYGIDGTGKTSTAVELTTQLNSSGIPTINYDIEQLKLYNPISLAKKDVLRNCPPEEQFMYYLASTMYHSRQIRKIMGEGYSVVKGRYLLDVQAHHSYLGVNNVQELSELSGILNPDLEVVLVLNEQERRRRIGIRGIVDEKDEQLVEEGSRLHFFQNYLLSYAGRSSSKLIIDTENINTQGVALQIKEFINTL